MKKTIVKKSVTVALFISQCKITKNIAAAKVVKMSVKMSVKVSVRMSVKIKKVN